MSSLCGHLWENSKVVIYQSLQLRWCAVTSKILIFWKSACLKEVVAYDTWSLGEVWFLYFNLLTWEASNKSSVVWRDPSPLWIKLKKKKQLADTVRAHPNFLSKIYLLAGEKHYMYLKEGGTFFPSWGLTTELKWGERDCSVLLVSLYFFFFRKIGGLLLPPIATILPSLY